LILLGNPKWGPIWWLAYYIPRLSHASLCVSWAFLLHRPTTYVNYDVGTFRERSFSTLKRLKTYLIIRSSMGLGDEPPTSLALIHVHAQTNFKFYTHIHRIDRNKSPLKCRKM